MDPNTLLSVIEHTLRLLSCLVMTGAVMFIGYGLFFSKRLRPQAVWMYVGAVATATALWRWMVLVGGTDVVGNWISPISATLYFLTGVSLIILAVASSNRRKTDHGN